LDGCDREFRFVGGFTELLQRLAEAGGCGLIDHGDRQAGVDEDIILRLRFRGAGEEDLFDRAAKRHQTGSGERIFSADLEDLSGDGEAHKSIFDLDVAQEDLLGVGVVDIIGQGDVQLCALGDGVLGRFLIMFGEVIRRHVRQGAEPDVDGDGLSGIVIPDDRFNLGHQILHEGVFVHIRRVR
jgi:hypothetical protein